MGGPLDSALSDLRARIVAMGGLVIEQVITAVQALLEGDAEAAALVLARERQVNACDTAIEEAGFQFIARRAPVAGDLRTVTAIARAVTDLERAGDEAKKIARLALAAAAAGDRDVSLGVHRHLRHMARLSADMLRAAVGALERADATVAHDVARMDRELDREFQAALRQLMTVAMENGRLLRSTIDTVLILKSLERIGDHAKNVAEHVVFLVSGDDVRHARAERSAAGGQSAVH